MLQKVCLILSLVGSFLFTSTNAVIADDREDANALVGKWATQDFLGFDIEFKDDGTCSFSLGSAEWSVKKGKLVIKRPGIINEYDFTITPDNKTLRYDGRTWKRK